jgi:hypothetical protein
MTINLDTEIVATRFDAPSHTCFYTIARGGKRWTAALHIDALEKAGANKTLRRQTLAAALMNAMAGPPDEDET